MNKHTCLASADSVLSASWPDMSGGTDRVFCVARSLFYSLFFPQDTFRTVLAPPVCMRLSQFLNANPRDIQLYWVVKDVGASYDGLIDLSEFNSNKATGQLRKCSIDSS